MDAAVHNLSIGMFTRYSCANIFLIGALDDCRILNGVDDVDEFPEPMTKRRRVDANVDVEMQDPEDVNVKTLELHTMAHNALELSSKTAVSL